MSWQLSTTSAEAVQQRESPMHINLLGVLVMFDRVVASPYDFDVTFFCRGFGIITITCIATL